METKYKKLTYFTHSCIRKADCFFLRQFRTPYNEPLSPLTSTINNVPSIPNMNPGWNATIHLPPPSLTVSGTPQNVYPSELRNVMTIYIYIRVRTHVFLLPVLHLHLCAYFCIHGVCMIPLGVSPVTIDRVMILWSFSEETAHTEKVRPGMRSRSQPPRRLTVYRFKLTRIYQLQDLYVIHTNSPYTRLL